MYLLNNKNNNQYTPKKTFLVIAALAVSLFMLASSVHATCNAVGCWNETIKSVKTDKNGRIWLITNNSANLNNLAPADGCVVKSIWTGIAEPALYIPTNDPYRSEKYSAMLLALATGDTVGFGPVLDPATGWCALAEISVTP